MWLFSSAPLGRPRKIVSLGWLLLGQLCGKLAGGSQDQHPMHPSKAASLHVQWLWMIVRVLKILLNRVSVPCASGTGWAWLHAEIGTASAVCQPCSGPGTIQLYWKVEAQLKYFAARIAKWLLLWVWAFITTGHLLNLECVAWNSDLSRSEKVGEVESQRSTFLRQGALACGTSDTQRWSLLAQCKSVETLRPALSVEGLILDLGSSSVLQVKE